MTPVEWKLGSQKKNLTAYVKTLITAGEGKKPRILSLAGLLQHATKVVRCGRSFVACMHATAAKVKQLDYFTKLGREFRSDPAWYIYLEIWNGLSMLRGSWSYQPDYTVQTDASGSWGCGAFLKGLWLQWQWPTIHLQMSIMAKELIPILFICAVCGPCIAIKYWSSVIISA